MSLIKIQIARPFTALFTNITPGKYPNLTKYIYRHKTLFENNNVENCIKTVIKWVVKPLFSFVTYSREKMCQNMSNNLIKKDLKVHNSNFIPFLSIIIVVTITSATVTIYHKSCD